MPTLSFGEYRPDVSDLEGTHTRNVLNVLPRGDGYGPVNSIEAFTASLPAQCRGYFFARNDDNTVTIFAGTATKLYRLSNINFTWVDVSRSAGTYTALSADANWSFAQFGALVIATQANDNVQVYDLSLSSAFDDLSGSPPDAAYVSVVNGFVVLSGLTSEPYRIQWSGLNDATGWTSGVNSSDYQDLPDGGIVRPVLGGEFGIILQDGAIRRMTFSPGSEAVFDIQRLAKDIGVLGPYSACNAGERAFFLTPKGFMQTDGSGALTPIGEEKVNRTFFDTYDSSNLQYVVAAADPQAHIVLWAFRSSGSSVDGFDRVLAYNYLLQRWAPLALTGEYIAALAAPGLTMEGLDAIAPGSSAISDVDDNGSGLLRVTVASTAGWSTGNYKTISGVVGSTAANGTWEIEVVDGTNIDLVGSAFNTATVVGADNNGSGAIRLEVDDSSAWETGDTVLVASVGGTVEANGDWPIEVIDATHIDLVGSTFSNAYTSGGTVSDYYVSGGLVAGSLDLLPFSLDAVSTGALPALSVCSAAHKIGFFSGENMEATLETPEQSGDGQRLMVRGFMPITDADDVRGRISKRENLKTEPTYTAETTMNAQGYVCQLRNTRYSRAQIRIPEGTEWTFASGVKPDADLVSLW